MIVPIFLPRPLVAEALSYCRIGGRRFGFCRFAGCPHLLTGPGFTAEQAAEKTRMAERAHAVYALVPAFSAE